jgi:hypothetical protein
MAKKWTHTAAFAYFGTKPRNVQWSWSARSDDGKTVVVTLWQDEFKRQGNKMVYARPGNLEEPDTRPGHVEMMQNMQWAIDHLDGRVNVITAIAKDKNAKPRSIAECAPTKMRARVVHLDHASGAFTFEAELA